MSHKPVLFPSTVPNYLGAARISLFDGWRFRTLAGQHCNERTTQVGTLPYLLQCNYAVCLIEYRSIRVRRTAGFGLIRIIPLLLLLHRGGCGEVFQDTENQTEVGKPANENPTVE